MARITQQNKEETRAAIIREAYTLFNETGYDKTNTKSIAKRCGIAEGTIFNYFATKDDILMAIFKELSAHSPTEEIPSSISPIDILIDILIVPLRKLNRIPKTFMVDIIVSAMKLTRKNKDLLHSLIALDMSYVLKVEEKMHAFLTFEDGGMDAKILSEVLYATLASDYLQYILDDAADFNDFEDAIRHKLRLLIKPYLKD